MMGARPGGGPKAAPGPPQSQFAGFDPSFFGCAEEIMHREAKQARAANRACGAGTEHAGPRAPYPWGMVAACPADTATGKRETEHAQNQQSTTETEHKRSITNIN